MNERYDHTADVYSFSMVLLEMVHCLHSMLYGHLHRMNARRGVPSQGGVAPGIGRIIRVLQLLSPGTGGSGSSACSTRWPSSDDSAATSTSSSDATLEPTNWLDTFSDAHNVVIDEGSGLLYAVGTNLAGGGIVVVDQYNGFNGAQDKYDWTYEGKKTMVVPFLYT